MTNPVLQETIIRTMEDVPERLRNVYSKEILNAFFEKGNYLIRRIVPSGDTRFYLDSGKRITSAMDFLKPLQKQGVYFEGYSVNGGKKSKVNVVMLADISGSCRAMTSLALTYMGLMREVFPGGCHLFVFVNHLVPVDRYFSNENVTAAVESINKNVPSRGIYSNYGMPLKELRYDNTGIINKDTTIVMLGDCRNNRNYSGVEEVEWLSKRASNFFVLNPEPRDEWGQGDSIADLYAKSGAVVSMVGSTKDLLTFLQSAGTTRHF